MKKFGLIIGILVVYQFAAAQAQEVVLFPAHNATGVNPDTHLVLDFNTTPTLGTAGQIRIRDAATGRLVDMLDLSIPPGPTESDRTRVPYTEVPYVYIPGKRTNANTRPGTPSGTANPTPDNYQLTIIGGFTDGFHFYPVIIHGNQARIYPHHNLLEYGKTYYVEIDPGVLTVADDSFKGIKGESGWRFSTKLDPPPAGSKWLVVSGEGTGDFNTVQGAIDFLPDWNPERVTIYIENGRYEEIVYFRHKSNITFLGEDREKTRVCYTNTEIFNPHPKNVATNEWPGTFPSRRAAFMGDVSSGIHIVNLTIENTIDRPAQAEGLLLVGERHIIKDTTIIGSGDALQINGSVYLENIQMTGFGDNVLGRGPAFFKNCELITTYGPHLWIRNTAWNHGNILVDCTLRSIGDVESTIARRNDAHVNCEAVLINCKLEGIRPAGWGSPEDNVETVHYWEYNSTNLEDGTPVDVSQRHPISRQLTMENDADLIAQYSDPTWVLGGWTPEMAPIILTQPELASAKAGQPVTLNVRVAAIPEASYQWLKDGKAIAGATNSTLAIENMKANDAGRYSVEITNTAGSTTSRPVPLAIQ